MAFEVFKMVGTVAINREQALRDIQVIKQGVEKSSKEMQGSLQKFTAAHSASFKKIGMIATAAGAIISLAVKKVGNSFDIYETALVDMGKITDESLESIENRMKELPPILGSLTELTRGYYQIVSAGIRDPVLAIDTLIISAETAAAAHVNQSEVVKGLTKVMAGYEGKIEDVSEAADLMFAIEKEGQTTVAEMIPLIGGLASASANLNIHQNEMAASMAVITRTAGNSAAAATMYEGVLLGLMKPTEAMTTALKGMGYASAQAAIEELGFVEVLRRLDEVTGGSAEKLGELFGRKQAIMGMTKLTAMEMRPLADAIDSVADKAGMADKAFQDWTTTGDAFNKEQKAVTENLLTLIGKAIDPMMDAMQRRMIETIAVMGEWIDKNEEMAASILMWTGGIGMALVPLGLLAMTFPGLVLMADKLIILWPKIGIATGLLSAKFALLAASIGLSTGGLSLLLAGLTAIGLYIGNEWKKAWEEGQRIKEMEIKSTEAQTKALEGLQKAYGLTEDEMGKVAENMREGKHLLDGIMEGTDKYIGTLNEAAQAEAEFIAVQKEAIETSKERIKSFEDLDAAVLNSIIKGEELTEQQENYMTLRQRMTDIGRTATQKKLDDLDRENIALIANMSTNLMTMEQIDEYRKVMRQHIIAESSEREEHLRNMEDIETKLFELTHTQTEARIRDLELERDALIETAESSYESYEKRKEAIAEIIKWHDLEKEAILEKREEYVIYLDAMKSIEDRMFEITHTQREIEIRDLDKKKAKLIEIATQAGLSAVEEIAAIKKIIDWYKKEIALLMKKEGIIAGKRYNVFDKYGKDFASVGSEKAQEMLEMGYDVMEIPSNTPTQQPGVILSEYPEQMEQGGAVKSFIDVAKFLARGGSTDTVPIVATPGEYVIKKSMVDFIRRTGMVTGGLVEAIQRGMPTPSPAFASGGMVARWTGSSPNDGGLSLPSVQKSGRWEYNINFNNPIVRSEEDLEKLKELVEEVVAGNIDVLDTSGNEIGV